MTLQTNLYRLWFVIPALFDWPKERFHFDILRTILTKNMAKAIVMYRLYCISYAFWLGQSLKYFSNVAWRHLQQQNSRAIVFSFQVLACCGEKVRSFHSFIAGRAESLFSINFFRCLTVGKSIHRDFGANFTHLLAGNHLDLEHKIK